MLYVKSVTSWTTLLVVFSLCLHLWAGGGVVLVKTWSEIIILSSQLVIKVAFDSVIIFAVSSFPGFIFSVSLKTWNIYIIFQFTVSEFLFYLSLTAWKFVTNSAQNFHSLLEGLFDRKYAMQPLLFLPLCLCFVVRKILKAKVITAIKV